MPLSKEAIGRIINSETWFSPSATNWRGALTEQQLAALTSKWSLQLRRRPQHGLRPDADQLQLASQISGCQEHHRCGLAICPHCHTAVQRWVTNGIVGLTAQEPKDCVYTLSIIPPLPSEGVLTVERLKATMASVKKMLEKTGLVDWAVICLDISWNDYRPVAQDWPDDARKFGWCPHVYVHIKIRHLRQFKKAIASVYSSMLGVPVPVKMYSYDGTAYAASYAFKLEFQRRVSFFNKDGKLQAEDYRLPAALNVEMMRAVGEFGLAGRIDLIGLQVIEHFGMNSESLTIKKKMVG